MIRLAGMEAAAWLSPAGVQGSSPPVVVSTVEFRDPVYNLWNPGAGRQGRPHLSKLFALGHGKIFDKPSVDHRECAGERERWPCYLVSLPTCLLSCGLRPVSSG